MFRANLFSNFEGFESVLPYSIHFSFCLLVLEMVNRKGCGNGLMLQSPKVQEEKVYWEDRAVHPPIGPYVPFPKLMNEFPWKSILLDLRL